MQNQVLIAKVSNEFKIHTNLDVKDSTFITNLLFNYVQQGKITFELKSKSGSIANEIIINVLGGLFSAVLYDLIKKLHQYIKEKKKDKKVNPIYIFTEKKEYVLTGEESDNIPD